MIRTAKNTEIGDWIINKDGTEIWRCEEYGDLSGDHYRIAMPGETIPAGTKLKRVRPMDRDHMDDVLASLDFKILNSSPYMYAIVELPKGESEVDRRIKAAQKELDAALEARKAEHE